MSECYSDFTLMKKKTPAKSAYTDITFVLDRSGSMGSVRDDTIGGFNSFISEQKKIEGECNLTMVQFDTEYEFVHKNQSITKVAKLDHSTFVPRGMTALLDAVGRAITETGKRFADMEEEDRPQKVIFVIQTDGHENSSREFTRAQIKEMISHQQSKYNWEFIFLGANQDAITAGASMGISSGKSLSYASNTIGTQNVYKSVNKIVSNIRSGKGPTDFEASDRDEQRKAGAGK